MSSFPVVAVTILEDRATVTRRGAVPLPAGQHRVVIDHVSPILADKSLIATAEGAKLIDVRCERRRVAVGDRETLAPLEAERVERAAAAAVAEGQVTAAKAEAAALADVAAAALHDLATAAARGIAVANAEGRLAELDALEAAARAKVVDGELALADLSRALRRLEARIAQLRTHTDEEVARLVVDVIADAPAEIALAITYVVPGAAWRPYHRARLVVDPAPRVDWQTTACIWQATGEDWVDAQLVCSLERPSLGTEPPTLVDDELRVRRRPDTVVVETRDQEQQTTGLGGGTAGPLEVPGIDDGGLGLTLTAARATVRADGAPHRIDVGGFTAAVQLARVAIPLRSPWVHVRARIVNPSSTPLLAGPVDLIMASGYVGRAEIGFVAPNEKFYVGFGPDAALRVHRTESKDREEPGVLSGTTTVTTRVAVRLSNLGDEAREIVVTERVPISEVEQVDVQVGAPDAFLLADDEPGHEEITQVTARALDDRGLVTWSVELPPHGRRAVTLEYRVKSARGVAGI